MLIDFGSARFDTAEATSTKVTFHTPPYAAIEQYVKTYPQGPWTDIYALGVVMYECITGEKPPEVLERLHAGLGKPLAEGKWPGYSKKFLAAIDAAMVVKPDERPQTLSDWLAMFGKPQRRDRRGRRRGDALLRQAGRDRRDRPGPADPERGSEGAGRDRGSEGSQGRQLQAGRRGNGARKKKIELAEDRPSRARRQRPRTRSRARKRAAVVAPPAGRKGGRRRSSSRRPSTEEKSRNRSRL